VTPSKSILVIALASGWIVPHGLALAALQAPPTPQPEPSSEAPVARPGLLHVGPFFITPKLRIGTIGVDTNVFYGPTDRRTDLTASGSPGLEIVLPIGESMRFTSNGALDYLYFLRTRSQRRLTGSTGGRFDWKGGRTEVSLQETYGRRFSRPSFEVDRRIVQIQESTRANLRRKLFGRTALAASASRTDTRVPSGESFLGTDLSRTLSTKTYEGDLQLEYAITVKTAFLVEAARAVYRFPFARARDGRFDHARAGLRTSSTALISGQALVGVGWFRPDEDSVDDRRFLDADADLIWHVSPRTRLGGSYRRASRYSAHDMFGAPPTVHTEVFGASLEKELVGRRLDFRVAATATRSMSAGPIALTLSNGERRTLIRDETFRTAFGDLGYRFRFRLRIGVTAGYAERRSSVSDLGIDGLIVGGTITFAP
jgi:hypothetical protein